MYDYIIVGAGLAGIAFAHIAISNNKKVLVFDNPKLKSSSEVAAGVYNPIIFKRYTLTNHAVAQLELLHKFYTDLESLLQQKILFKLDSLKKFNSIEDQNLFLEKSDRTLFTDFLKGVFQNNNKSVIAPFGFGLVEKTGYLDVKKIIVSYQKYLQDNQSFKDVFFDYSKLKIIDHKFCYEEYMASKIVFCEGYGLKQNPFFEKMPIEGVKGELLEIYSEALNLKEQIKASVFILPTKVNHYLVGATYDWEDKSDIPTIRGRQFLENELQKHINCEYKVVNHFAGIRPTVKDRMPLLGRHSEHSDMYILNGMGTRGVMNSPYYAQMLYDFIILDKPLDKKVDIERFRK